MKPWNSRRITVQTTELISELPTTTQSHPTYNDKTIDHCELEALAFLEGQGLFLSPMEGEALVSWYVHQFMLLKMNASLEDTDFSVVNCKQTIIDILAYNWMLAQAASGVNCLDGTIPLPIVAGIVHRQNKLNGWYKVFADNAPVLFKEIKTSLGKAK